MDRILLWLYNHKVNGDPSVLNCPQTHTEDDTPPCHAYSMEISVERTKLMTNNTSGINTEIKVNGQ